MTDLAQQELACAIVHDAVRKYIATRRERIDPFVDRHFTLVGSLALHRKPSAGISCGLRLTFFSRARHSR